MTKAREEQFKATLEEVAKRRTFEAGIKRPYAAVRVRALARLHCRC